MFYMYTLAIPRILKLARVREVRASGRPRALVRRVRLTVSTPRAYEPCAAQPLSSYAAARDAFAERHLHRPDRVGNSSS